MVDLGIVQLPIEALHVLAIVTALCLAACWIGFDVVAAIGGTVAAIYGLRIALYQYEASLQGYKLGTTEGWLLVILGGFLVYRGTASFLDGEDASSWK